MVLGFIFWSSVPSLCQTQLGYASHYAKSASGARTANGERLHHDSMTCAHRTFPFGTVLQVTHLRNGRTILVRVNDRGPYTSGRIIDLSWEAAKQLGMLHEGIAKVSVHRADNIVIPLLAPKEHIVFPKLEVESIEMADTIKPIWQEDLLIEHKVVQKKKRSKKALK